MMDENVFNSSIRKFLKSLGVTAQRKIEGGAPSLGRAPSEGR
jgi:hypothetical protein